MISIVFKFLCLSECGAAKRVSILNHDFIRRPLAHICRLIELLEIAQFKWK